MKQEKITMKFKDAPIGSRFIFIDDDLEKDIYVKIHANGNVGYMSRFALQNGSNY